jgi:hypothetical protein
MAVQRKSRSMDRTYAEHMGRSAASGLPRYLKRKRGMSDLVFILLTVAIFALLSLIVKAVERL